MKSFRHILLLLAIASAIFCCDAQDVITSLCHEVIPPSPTSAVFRKYDAQQPSLSTGAVRINVPIYTISYKGVEIPFELNYLSNGIKVLDLPYPCGFGWTLTPALRVSRSIMGRPDEIFEFVGDESWSQKLNELRCDEYALARKCMIDPTLRLPDIHKYDSWRDIFTISLLDGSHTMVIKKADGKIKFEGVYEEIDAEADEDLSIIRVTDSKGVRYKFGPLSEQLESSALTTSWMLDSIALPNGEGIGFHWSRFNNGYPDQAVFGGYSWVDKFEFAVNDFEQLSDPTQNGSLTQLDEYVWLYRLDAVDWPSGTLDISYFGRFINDITVWDKSHNFIKSAAFTYDTYDGDQKLLTSVTLSGEGRYEFAYNPQRFQYIYAQDYWGYYNGKINSSLVPALDIRTSLVPSTGGHFIYGILGSADREPDEEMMQANLITKVRYPTGGTTDFEYEAHRFIDPGLNDTDQLTPECNHHLNMGGGVRVKKTVTRPSPTEPDSIVRVYTYGVNEDGLAQCVNVPSPATFIDVYGSGVLNWGMDGRYTECRMVMANISSNYMSQCIGESPIWYNEVTEHNHEGKIVRHFAKFTGDNTVIREFGKRVVRRICTAFSLGPVMYKEDIYEDEDSAYRKVQTTQWHYSLTRGRKQVFNNVNIVRNYIQTAITDNDMPDFPLPGNDNAFYPSFHFVPEDVYTIVNCPIEAFTERLDSVCKTVFTPNGEYKSKESMTYVPYTRLVATKRTSDNSGKTIVCEYKYPKSVSASDFIFNILEQSSVAADMAARNIIATPMVTRSTFLGETSVNQNIFSSIGNAYYPTALVYRVNNRPGIRLCDYEYDTHGNLISYSVVNGEKCAFVWDADTQLPILKIEGMSRSEIISLAGANSLVGINAANLSLRAQSLRETLVGNALVSAYVYRPLVGISSETAPNGIKFIYGYDDFNRLSQIARNPGGSLQTFYYNVASDASDYSSANYICSSKNIGPSNNALISYDHYDGLGRPIETICAGLSPDGGNISTFSEYDEMGRLTRVWNPVPTTGSLTIPHTLSDIASAAQAYYDDGYAYSQTIYRPSALAMEAKIYRQGELLHSQDKYTSKEIYTNSNSQWGICYDFSIATNGNLKNNGIYPNGTLGIEKVTNENGGEIYTFVDIFGRKLLQRRLVSQSCYADTYYVYDGLGRLRYVLPPLLSDYCADNSSIGHTWNVDDDALWEYAYYYEYDVVGNVTKSKWPGREATLNVYDRQYRLVATQDGNQRPANEWTYYVYDRLNRVAMEGSFNLSAGQVSAYAFDAVVAERSSEGSSTGYSIYPPARAALLSDPHIINYYDDYNFVDNLDIPTAYRYVSNSQYDGRYASATGMLTGQIISGTPTVPYYDASGNIVQSHTKNAFSLVDDYYAKYTLDGRKLGEYRTHKDSESSDRYEAYAYEYDSKGRLLSCFRTSEDGLPVKLFSNEYDELGLLSANVIGDSIAVVRNSYDVQNRLCSISSSHFSQDLTYESRTRNDYSGKITSNSWRSHNPLVNTYTYTYDLMGRLTKAENMSMGTEYTYDKHSNPLSIVRMGMTRQFNRLIAMGTIDDLALSYAGNRLVSVDENAATVTYPGAEDYDQPTSSFAYQWDANGNMTSDPSRRITSIGYNRMNQPVQMDFEDGSSASFTYDATGKKLSARHIVRLNDNALREYNYIYDDNVIYSHTNDVESDSILSSTTSTKIMTPNGFVCSGQYYFNIKDYQGNVRVVLNSNGARVAQYNYYPYGMWYNQSTDTDVALNPAFKFADKEFIAGGGVNLYDFGPRWYDHATIGFSKPDIRYATGICASPYLNLLPHPSKDLDTEDDDSERPTEED